MSFRRMFDALTTSLRDNPNRDATEALPIQGNLPAAQARIPRWVNVPVYLGWGFWKSQYTLVPTVVDNENGTIKVDPAFVEKLCNDFNVLINNPDVWNNMTLIVVPLLGIAAVALEAIRKYIDSPSPIVNGTLIGIEGLLATAAAVLAFVAKIATSRNEGVGLDAHESRRSLGCRGGGG